MSDYPDFGPSRPDVVEAMMRLDFDHLNDTGIWRNLGETMPMTTDVANLCRIAHPGELAAVAAISTAEAIAARADANRAVAEAIAAGADAGLKVEALADRLADLSELDLTCIVFELDGDETP
jgi:hypothetical protein